MSAEPPAGLPRKGLVFVLSSPSGAGKSTLSRLLLEGDGNVQLSISVTTRARRGNEVEGRHYYFLDVPRFREMAEGGRLLEHAEVHGNLYGTPRAPVEAALAAGRDVLFDIDWQGTRQLAQAMPDDVVRVFVLPPSMRELRARLERRAEDAAETIARRLRNAHDEIERWRDYDYVIVNDDLERSFETVKAILTAERTRRERVTGLAGFVAGLLG